VTGDKGYMSYQQACAIFGYQMNERLERREIKKRFNSLALKYHPDHGGTSEQFMLLQEAHKLLMTHRHDKDETFSGEKKSRFKFRKVNYDDVTNTIHRESVDRKETRSFSIGDIVFFAFVITAFFAFYMYRALENQAALLRSKWRMVEDSVKPPAEGSNAWHPWSASQADRDWTTQAAIIQGSIKQQMFEEKKRERELPMNPLTVSSPFVKISPDGPQQHHS
jgi:curved DNA-binding protein CbpA